MRVLLISVNKQKSYRPVLPVGMAIVAAQARQAGHHVDCLDLCFETEDQLLIRQHVTATTPDVIGISVRNVDSQNFLEPTYYLPFVRQVVTWCRDLPHPVPIVLGGAGFSQLPREIMAYTRADYGIAGFGERSFPHLLEQLAAGNSPVSIPGLLRWTGDGALEEESIDVAVEYDDIAPVDRHDYDSRYFSYGFQTHGGDQHCVEPVQTKKGCVLDCIFCGNFRVEGRSITLKPVERVVDEIERIAATGGSGFEFVDGVFNLPLPHALNVCREMQRRKIDLPWSCQLNPGAVTEELGDLMAATGCRHVEFGTDSGSDAILATLRKNFRRRHIMDAHQLVAARGLEIVHCVFVGAPGDTPETIDETLTLLEQLIPPEAQVGNQGYISLGMRICEGSELHRIALTDGTLPKNATLGIPRFYVAPGILENPELLDEIERRVTANAHWYLWWGLPRISLKERVTQVKRLERKTEQLYRQALQDRNHDGH